MRVPHVVSDAELARQALRSILQDRDAPAAAKASAARTLAEIAGALGKDRVLDDSLPNAFGMTRAEINAELQGLDSKNPKQSKG